jgi:long-chain acyl-CoA synthetase
MSRWTAANYVHPTPWDTTVTPLPLPELLLQSAARKPDAVALDFYGRQTRYGELADQVRRAAAGFAAIGVGPGVHVGLFLPNSPHYVIAYYAVLLAGGTLVNFSPLYNEQELSAQVADSGATIMVSLDVQQLYPTLAAVAGHGGLKRLVIGNLPEVLPWPQAWGYRLLKRSDRHALDAPLPHTRFAELLSHPPIANPPPIAPERDVALLQYTGGTTGVPKGAVLTHANLCANAQQVVAVDPHAGEEDRILGALPFFHVFANTAVLNRTILEAGEIVMMPKFELKAALHAIASRKLTAVPGVPTMYRAMLDSPLLKETDLSSLRVCISGGAPLPLELKRDFEAATGARLVEGYGLTESSGVVAVNPYEGLNKPGSIGQPLPQTDIILLDRDDPTRLAIGDEPGELAVAGPQIMQGYHNRPDTGVFAEIDGRRYLRTGDVATIDADGYVFIVDRLKDMIAVGGFKVFPSALEASLYQHPDVREAIVIGVPDTRLGERPKAFVTLKPGASATGGALLDWLNARVGKHERAVAVEVRDELPKTMIGKLSRKELVAEERAKAAQAAKI